MVTLYFRVVVALVFVFCLLLRLCWVVVCCFAYLWLCCLVLDCTIWFGLFVVLVLGFGFLRLVCLCLCFVWLICMGLVVCGLFGYCAVLLCLLLCFVYFRLVLILGYLFWVWFV